MSVSVVIPTDACDNVEFDATALVMSAKKIFSSAVIVLVSEFGAIAAIVNSDTSPKASTASTVILTPLDKVTVSPTWNTLSPIPSPPTNEPLGATPSKLTSVSPSVK